MAQRKSWIQALIGLCYKVYLEESINKVTGTTTIKEDCLARPRLIYSGTVLFSKFLQHRFWVVAMVFLSWSFKSLFASFGLRGFKCSSDMFAEAITASDTPVFHYHRHAFCSPT